MPDSTREAALKALLAALQGIAGPTVLRNETEEQAIPVGGLIILNDGDAGEPEPTLSPTAYFFEHRADVVVQVQGATAAGRDAVMDDLLQSINTAIAADDTLGGAVDVATPKGVDVLDEAVDGGQGIKAALVPVVLEYASELSTG